MMKSFNCFPDCPYKYSLSVFLQCIYLVVATLREASRGTSGLISTLSIILVFKRLSANIFFVDFTWKDGVTLPYKPFQLDCKGEPYWFHG